MSAESHQPGEPKKRARVRLWFVAAVLCAAALFEWLAWPSSEAGIGVFDLSRANGKPRFFATTYSKMQAPPHPSPYQRVLWTWMEYQRRYGKKNPAAFSFPASPIGPCSIHGLLNQCMEVTGTRYLIAVEIAGAVEFGHTNTLSGGQWVAAFEHAIETSGPIMCYDYAKKRNFEDTLLLIRERPRLVKVVPRSKLAEYRKAGLVKEDKEKSESPGGRPEPKSETDPKQM